MENNQVYKKLEEEYWTSISKIEFFHQTRLTDLSDNPTVIPKCVNPPVITQSVYSTVILSRVLKVWLPW